MAIHKDAGMLGRSLRLIKANSPNMASHCSGVQVGIAVFTVIWLISYFINQPHAEPFVNRTKKAIVL